jgi:hypothetical protein
LGVKLSVFREISLFFVSEKMSDMEKGLLKRLFSSFIDGDANKLAIIGFGWRG